MDTTRIGNLILAAAVVGAWSTGGTSVADDQATLKAFYFGNSFLENSVPWFHPTLAATAGCKMKVQTQLGPGWQIWMHVDTFYKNPERAKKTLAEGDWNAVVIQHFGAHPLLKDNVRTTHALAGQCGERWNLISYQKWWKLSGVQGSTCGSR